MAKGVIFDMDGTMVDNMMIHHRAWQRKLSDLGLEMTLDEVKEKIHGINEEIILRLFGDRFNAEERQRIAWEKEAEYRRIFNPKLLEGLPRFLEKLKIKGIPMAIGTAAPPENADFILDTLNLRGYFQGVFHSKSVSKGKPNPEIFHKAAASMGLASSDCIVFEDSVSGAETAKRAGAKAIILTTTHQREEFQQFSHILRFMDDFTGINVSDILNA